MKNFICAILFCLGMLIAILIPIACELLRTYCEWSTEENGTLRPGIIVSAVTIWLPSVGVSFASFMLSDIVSE